MKSFVLSFIILFLITIVGYGQDPFYVNYTIDDGLPSNEVYDAEIDADGLLWFTTDRGVFTYDSYQFTTYTTYDGLGDNVNFEIFKDSNGVLWFFGYNGKVTLFEDGEFSLYQYNDELRHTVDSLRGNYIKEIQEGEDKKLYLTCNDQGFFEIITLNKTSKPKIFQVNSENNVFQIDSAYFYKTINKTTGRNTSISFQQYLLPLVLPIDTTENINFIFDDTDYIWYTTTSNNTLKQKFKKNITSKLFLNEYECTSTVKDYNEGYWITTRNKGIIYISNINILPIQFDSENENSNFLHFHKFSKYLLCGTSSSSFIQIDTQNKTRETTLIHTNKNIDVDQFQTINNGKEISVLNQNIQLKNGKYIIRSSTKSKKNLITSNSDTIFNSKRGLLICTPDEYMYSNFESSKKALNFAEDNEQNIWIGTLNGVYIINDFDYQNPVELLTDKKEPLGRISDIVVDKNNNKWICTIGNGIFIKNKGKLLHFDSDNGLTSNIVNTLEVTKDNQIWVATNKGLNLLEYSNTVHDLTFIEAFDQSDGLISSYINDVIQWNEKIYVATPNGICHFDPTKITKSNSEIPLNINSVLINDKKVSRDSLIELQYNQNKIDIKYTAIRHNKNNEQILYKYSLTKNNEPNTWNYINDRVVIFNNLDHGDYTFEVNASNKFNEWNSSSEKIYFTIHPHYTDILWFKLLFYIISLILILLIGLFFFRRYQKSKATELALEEARTRAKEAELSALRNQMNPHFIFNSLNTIQNFIFKKDVVKANYLLSKFSSLIRKSLNYSRLEAISIEKEIQFLTDYIELEKVRFPDRITLNFSIDKDIDPTLFKIPSLLLQPLVENSIKHGISKSIQPGEISVTFETVDNIYIRVTVFDTGNGLSQKSKPNNDHISLGHQILKDRIQILKSKGYPNTSFNINKVTSSVNLGYEVILILPIL